MKAIAFSEAVDKAEEVLKQKRAEHKKTGTAVTRAYNKLEKLKRDELRGLWDELMTASKLEEVNWDFFFSNLLEASMPKKNSEDLSEYKKWNKVIQKIFKCNVEKVKFSNGLWGKKRKEWTSFNLAARKENKEGIIYFLKSLTGHLKSQMLFRPIEDYKFSFYKEATGNFAIIDLVTKQMSEHGIDTLFVREDGEQYIVFRYSHSWVKEEYYFSNVEDCVEFLCSKYRAPEYCVYKEEN